MSSPLSSGVGGGGGHVRQLSRVTGRQPSALGTGTGLPPGVAGSPGVGEEALPPTREHAASMDRFSFDEVKKFWKGLDSKPA